MTDNAQEDVALFRFGVISDLVGASRFDHGEFGRLVEQKSRHRWNIPGSGRTRLSTSTIRRWVALYEKSGRQLNALRPATRSDLGRSRRVDEDTVLGLVKLRKAKPGLPVAHLITEMVAKVLVSPGYPVPDGPGSTGARSCAVSVCTQKAGTNWMPLFLAGGRTEVWDGSWMRIRLWRSLNYGARCRVCLYRLWLSVSTHWHQPEPLHGLIPRAATVR
jgi:hypothetical protein